MTRVKLFLENLEIIPKLGGRKAFPLLETGRRFGLLWASFTSVSSGRGNTDVARIEKSILMKQANSGKCLRSGGYVRNPVEITSHGSVMGKEKKEYSGAF